MVATAAVLKKKDLQSWSRDMEDFTTNVPELLKLIDLKVAVTEPEILEAVGDWIQSAGSRALWVLGRAQETYPSQVTAIAAKVLDVALEWKIPVLCCFSNTDDDDNFECQRINASPHNNQEENILIDLMYSLIRQLINNLLRETNFSRKLSRAYFERFDGSIETFKPALKFFKDLFQHAPTNLYIIIDGIDRLDGSSAEPFMQKLLDVLQDIVTDTRSHRVVKVLYTTAGQCESLALLDDDFLENVEPRVRKAKHAGRCMKPLSQLHFESEESDQSLAGRSDNE